VNTVGGQKAASPPLERWELLHSKLPAAAIRPLATSVYGVAGLSDVNEGYLIRRLFKSGMTWEWRIVKQEYLGAEDRQVRDKDYTQRYYLAAVHGELNIEGRIFHGSGASDNRKVDAAYKGANTVAFKNACKWAGLTAELFLDGRAIDDIHGRVLKDPEMVPERQIGEIVAWAEGASGSDQREGSSGAARVREEDAPAAETQALPQPQQAPEAISSQSKGGETDPPQASAETGELDLSDLFALGRTLRTPVTALVVTNQVAEHGMEGVRRRLILAHARDHGPACEHVAQLAGLAAPK
jgi:hypothetical protein